MTISSARIKMPSSLLQKSFLFILFHLFFINCTSLPKRDLERPESVLARAFCFFENEATSTYAVDYYKPHQIPLHDLRNSNKKPDLKTFGFTWVSGTPATGIENLVPFSDEHKAALAEDAVKRVKELIGPGAKAALSFGSAFRDHATPAAETSVSVLHSDFSARGAKWKKSVIGDRLLRSSDPGQVKFGKHLKEGKDVLILGFWRPIRTVEDNHLGFCKWDTLLKDDALPTKFEPTRSLNALQPWQYRSDQKWFYLSKQEPDEAFIFMQHDSTAKDDHGVNVPHASFNLEGHEGPFTRASFETKVIVIVDPPIRVRLLRAWKRIKSILTQSMSTQK